METEKDGYIRCQVKQHNSQEMKLLLGNSVVEWRVLLGQILGKWHTCFRDGMRQSCD